jgi:hypothetical protein
VEIVRFGYVSEMRAEACASALAAAATKRSSSAAAIGLFAEPHGPRPNRRVARRHLGIHRALGELAGFPASIDL